MQSGLPEDAYAKARAGMVSHQLEQRGIRDPRVLAAMRGIPRHRFCPADQVAFAYEDHPLPIGHGQTISQPYIVAVMTEALALQPTDSVLEIGTGSGYQTAVLAFLSRFVYSVELLPVLADKARNTLASLAIENVKIVSADGTLGLPEHAPFDAVLVTAGTPSIPPPLLEQLGMGGRLVAPTGDRYVQTLELQTRTEAGYDIKDLFSVVFVPLIGKFGWSSE
jgi:protein-L-isoaspartate(D-aspartate) O-methyltransferase